MTKLKSNQFILDGHTFTEIPILFSTEMVRSNMEDRKSQTRRKIKHQPDEECYYEIRFSDGYLTIDYNGGDKDPKIKCPYGKPGDLLWVRETHKLGAWREDGRMAFDYKASPELVNTPWVRFEDDYSGEKTNAVFQLHTDFLLEKGYESDHNGHFYWLPGKSPFPWKPSIHMPKAAARLWLMVEEIRVERLQEISEEDAKAEGIEPVADGWKNYRPDLISTSQFCWPTAYHSFQSLWESINGSESWDNNPWLWAIKFRILSKTGRPSDDVILENWEEVRHA